MLHRKGHTCASWLLIAFIVCCYSMALAAKISTKTTNTTNIELLTPATIATKTTTTTTTTLATTTKKPTANSSEEEDDDDNGADDEDADDDEYEEDGDTAGSTNVAGAAATALTPAEKNSVQPAAEGATSAFSIWGIVRNVWNWIKDDLSESLLGDDSSSQPTAAVEGRTFGKIRRLQMALIPLIFKFGILSAMVAFLVMLGMKTLFLVKLLVLMNAAAILAKFLTLKTNFGHFEHSAPAAPTWSYNSWNPHANAGWGATAPAPAPHAPSKEIHLHIHGGQVQPQVSSYSAYGVGAQGHHGWESRSDPYAAYEPAPVSETDIENELNNQGPMALLPTRYPANRRSY